MKKMLCRETRFNYKYEYLINYDYKHNNGDLVRGFFVDSFNRTIKCPDDIIDIMNNLKKII